MSGVGPITNSQICHISVDCWILVIELMIFLKVSGVGPITNSQIYHISVDCWILVIELMIFLKVSGVGPITNSQIYHISVDCWILVIELVIFWRCPELARLPTHKFFTFQLTAEYLSWSWPDYQLTNLSHFSWLLNTCHWIGDIFEGVQSCAVYQLINCHTDVDWWLLVIELVIFLKVSGFGLITKFQFCHIEVDWWLLYIKLVIFLHTDLIQWQFPVNFNVRYLWTGIIPNFNTVTLSILNFLAANLKVSRVGLITNSQICHISVDCWILVIEMVIFLKESGVGPITNSQICTHWSWLVNTFTLNWWIFEGVRSWPDYQLTNLITNSQICHISVDCWILIIELVIFLKESRVGPITNSQICNIDVDWWLLVIKLMIFLKVSGVGPITNSQIYHISVDCWILVIELVIFLTVSGVGPITNSQICHISVDWWLLVIELVIFLKVSGFGLITKFQFCHIEVDWWLLYIKLVIFLHTDLIQWQFPVNFNVRYLWTGIIPNFNTVTLSILNFLAANLKVSWVGPITNSQICHISVDCWILVIELVIFLKESGVGPITNSQICNIDVDW